MAELIQFGEPENESERIAAQYLREHLPDTYRLYTNLEIPRNGRLYEVDIILVAPHAVYIVDVKGVYGRVEVDRNEWYPQNRQSYPSPLKKYRQHARALSGLITDADPARRQLLRRVLVQGTVLLTTEDVEVIDVSDSILEKSDIVCLGEPSLKYFKNWQDINSKRFETKITSYVGAIDRAIVGRAKPRNRKRRFGSWEVIEELGEKEDKYVEYLAKKVTLGLQNRQARLRAYGVEPWIDATEREEAYRLISTAFQAVDDLPSHDNIVKVQDIFESAEADSLILVTEDIKGQSLRQLIRTHELTLEQKRNVIGDVLRGLEHAHKHGVIHRNIIPDNIFVTPEKQAKLTGFDYARIENRTGTIASAIADDLESSSIYQDFDCQNNPASACQKSDLFSAGQVFYELLMGEPAFKSFDEMYASDGVFPAPPSQKYPDLPNGFDKWLQKLCAFDRADRFTSAQEALDSLVPFSKVIPDLASLQPDTLLDKRYSVVERLGKPGSFAVAYKVFDSFIEDFQVIKIVVRDKYSLFERAQQEFKVLYNLLKHPHPYIVTARWLGQLHEYDDTPFIVFEYVEGKDLEEVLASRDLSLEESIEVLEQTAEGIAYLHQANIYHQDIKPSNLLLTDQGIKIIDFNVSVTSSDESVITAGTRRYLPPGFKPSIEPSKTDRIDRDLYALGITVYECITGRYPFKAAQPIVGQECLDPSQIEGCEDLGEGLSLLLQQAIAPNRADRFQSAQELLDALNNIKKLRQGSYSEEGSPKLLEASEVEQVGSEVESTSFEHSEAENEISADEVIKRIDEPTDPTSVPAHIETFRVPVPIAAETAPRTRATQKAEFPLFTLLPSSQQASPKLEQPIVLDPSKAYPVPDGYVTIETEVDWMRSFSTSDSSPYWVRGKTLCAWAEEWLICWNRSQLIADIKPVPRERLSGFLRPVQVPSDWSEEQCLAVVVRLEKYDQDAIAHLLSAITDSELQTWTEAPSIQNLAKWLAIEVPAKARVIEQAWQSRRNNSNLERYYQTDNKRQLLKQWLKMTEPYLLDLGAYPFEVPVTLQTEFDSYWERELYRNDAELLDSLNWGDQPEPKRIAQKAYEVLQQHPNYITKAREQKLRPYLSLQQYGVLSQRHRPPEPSSLSIDASPNEALDWATESYLPFRKWETVVSNLPQEQQVCDHLATSFENWMLENYPKLKVDSVPSSFLNYNVSHHIHELCKKGPVLWVVVDGLGWLDHQTLLENLTGAQQLQLEQALRPRFSILPTKTEYAKWSLYSQQLPGHKDWKDSAGKGFQESVGKRYTDNDVTKGRLQADLKKNKYRLYCWDTDEFDKLFHKEVDWQELFTVKRKRTLQIIADDILRFLEMHPQHEEMRVVIASDHGQLMGTSTNLPFIPKGLTPKGRMAIGRTDDPQLSVLDKDRFDLPHDISVVRGPRSFNSYSYADDKSVIGCHGGLYPEEVVVGFSVLKHSVKRAPVLVKCFGSGKPGESQTLSVEVNNPNALSIENCKLYIEQLPSLQQGRSLEITIPSNARQTTDVSVPDWPELPPAHEGNTLMLTGRLDFYYKGAEFSSSSLDRDSKIEINQVFSSGMQGGLDDFI